MYCPQADVYIDPWKPVKRALITHAHADHARTGNQHYLCVEDCEPVLRYRLGKIQTQTLAYGEALVINGVTFSFHPAGHIIGAAQIRVEYKGEVWVASGDYKTEDDGLCPAFEAVPCHTFITESTFGLPVYNWDAQEEVFAEINDWWRQNAAAGKATLLTGYSLGKAQRLLQGLSPDLGPVYAHGAIENTNAVLRASGWNLRECQLVDDSQTKKDFAGAMVLAPPSAANGAWIKRLGPVSVGMASGWMRLRGPRRRRGADRGFVLSDHADWTGLNQAIKATGCSRVIVTHGYTEIFTQYLKEQGYEAYAEKTLFEGELSEISEGQSAAPDQGLG